MDTNTFIDTTAPEILYVALEPITPLAGTGACAAYDPWRFASRQRQQAAFDGDPVDPAADYPAARAICQACPVLAACRRYADDSREEDTFLAGMSPDQRRARRHKKTEVAKRRLQVDALRGLGAPTSVIAELVGRDPSLVRGDLRTLDRQVRVRPSIDLPGTSTPAAVRRSHTGTGQARWEACGGETIKIDALTKGDVPADVLCRTY